MTSQQAFFTVQGSPDSELLHPQPVALSGWNNAQMRGPAVTSILARAAERAIASRSDLQPVRATFELFRPSRMAPSTTRATVVRQGRRLAVVDSTLVQDGEVVARAHILYLASTPAAGSHVWSPDMSHAPPSEHLVPDHNGQLYLSGDGEWTARANDHENSLRKQIWRMPTPVVHGEIPSAFQRAATASDIANLVVNWGDRGLEYINADVTLSMTRLPIDSGIGIVASQRFAADGIAVGSALLFDRSGLFGSANVSALDNAEQAVEVGAVLRG